MQESIEVPEIKIGQRVRFHMAYGNSLRPLGWIRAGPDGSIYVGALMDKPAASFISVTPISGPEIRVNYVELQKIDKPAKSSRISFHPDGRINYEEKHTQALVRLDRLQRPFQLCIFMPAHPRSYASPAEAAENDADIVLQGYQVDDECPLYAAVIVSPWTNPAKLITNLDGMIYFVGTAIGLRGFSRTPDLMIQFILGHGLKGQWTNDPIVVIRDKNKNLITMRTVRQ